MTKEENQELYDQLRATAKRIIARNSSKNEEWSDEKLTNILHTQKLPKGKNFRDAAYERKLRKRKAKK